MNRSKFYIVATLLTCLVWESAGCSGSAKQITGTYKVTGSPGVSANIIYAANGLGGNTTANNQTLPWQTTFNATETEGNYTGSYVFLSAVNDPPNSSNSITITILEDGGTYQQPNYTFCNGIPITLLGNF